MEQPDDRADLYKRFVRSAIQKRKSDFFDEDDLIELFDYATDLDDDFLKVEVMLYAAKHYPNSVELGVRRAYFYSILGNDSAAEMVNNAIKTPSILGSMLSVMLSKPAPEEAERLMLDLLAQVDDFTDEEVIQYVNIACRLGLYKWLIDNLSDIEAKCSYKPTLLYEVATIAEEHNQWDLSASLIERLTDIDPFNSDFWHRLALARWMTTQYAEALSAAEYALAINAADPIAMKLKARAMGSMGSEPRDVVALYKKVLLTAANEMEPDDYRILIATYAAADPTVSDMRLRNDMLGEIARAYATYPEERWMLDSLLAIDAYMFESEIRTTLEGMNYTEVSQWIATHIMAANPKGAYVIAHTYIKGKSLADYIDLPLHPAYLLGKFDTILGMFECLSDEERVASYRPQVVYPVVMSLVRLGHREQAKELLVRVIESANEAASFMPMARMAGFYEIPPGLTRTLMTGFITTLNCMLTALDDPNADPDKFDPLA